MPRKDLQFAVLRNQPARSFTTRTFHCRSGLWLLHHTFSGRRKELCQLCNSRGIWPVITVQLGILAHRIREAMVDGEGPKFEGVVEVDETRVNQKKYPLPLGFLLFPPQMALPFAPPHLLSSPPPPPPSSSPPHPPPPLPPPLPSPPTPALRPPSTPEPHPPGCPLPPTSPPPPSPPPQHTYHFFLLSTLSFFHHNFNSPPSPSSLLTPILLLPPHPPLPHTKPNTNFSPPCAPLPSLPPLPPRPSLPALTVKSPPTCTTKFTQKKIPSRPSLAPSPLHRHPTFNPKISTLRNTQQPLPQSPCSSSA